MVIVSLASPGRRCGQHDLSLATGRGRGSFREIQLDSREWDRRYESSEPVWGVEPSRFLVQETGDLAPGRALDVAAGEGRNAIWLAERGWRVLAVDFSRVALGRGARLAAERGVEVEWELADVTRWTPTPRGFDLVVVLYLHLEADTMLGVVRRAADAVAEGGTILVVGHDKANLERGHGGPRDSELLYTPGEIVGCMSGFGIRRAESAMRSVATDRGETHAVDCVVCAVRPAQI
jgi:SAM-dependent methyltransferase